MSTKKKSKKPAANLCWFEIPADNTQRARKFYSSLFGWKAAPLMSPAHDYWHIDTGGADASPDGGLMKRVHPKQAITAYISVASAAKSAAKVKKLGGTIIVNKTAVPKMGYFAICKDTEKNTFGLWELNPKAK